MNATPALLNSNTLRRRIEIARRLKAELRGAELTEDVLRGPYRRLGGLFDRRRCSKPTGDDGRRRCSKPTGDDGRRRCPHCGRRRPLSKFYFRVSVGRYGSWCVDCDRRKSRDRKAALRAAREAIAS